MEEKIAMAKARIKELKILIKHWEKQNPLKSSTT
jgi:DNA polymerase sigma